MIQIWKRPTFRYASLGYVAAVARHSGHWLVISLKSSPNRLLMMKNSLPAVCCVFFQPKLHALPFNLNMGYLSTLTEISMFFSHISSVNESPSVDEGL